MPLTKHPHPDAVRFLLRNIEEDYAILIVKDHEQSGVVTMHALLNSWLTLWMQNGAYQCRVDETNPSITRYRPSAQQGHVDSEPALEFAMDEHPEGDWVSFADHRVVEARRAWLQETLERRDRKWLGDSDRHMKEMASLMELNSSNAKMVWDLRETVDALTSRIDELTR